MQVATSTLNVKAWPGKMAWRLRAIVVLVEHLHAGSKLCVTTDPGHLTPSLAWWALGIYRQNTHAHEKKKKKKEGRKEKHKDHGGGGWHFPIVLTIELLSAT